MKTPQESNTQRAAVAHQQLVRLGREYTQIDMDEKRRRDAVESAHWRTASPHEWEWTPEQQANMALYCLWASQRLEMIDTLASGKLVSHEPATEYDDDVDEDMIPHRPGLGGF